MTTIRCAGVMTMALALLSVSLTAQDPPPRAPGAPTAVTDRVFDAGATTIPFFPLGESPLALSGPSRPGMFLSAVGRKAIAMGAEDGPLEMWSWPIKWLHDFELSFRVPKYTAPIPGRSVATSVTERPEGLRGRARDPQDGRLGAADVGSRLRRLLRPGRWSC